MLNQICICCGGRLAGPSPRNPNICLNCEQLLDDDCAELDRLMPEVHEHTVVNRVTEHIEHDMVIAEDEEEMHEPVQTNFQFGA
jgi:hypothetical protein